MKRPRYIFYSDLELRIKYKYERNNKYNGQLKLLLSTLHFLLDKIHVNDTILYIGSGKGYNIPTLIKIFSEYNLKWYLYDPNGHCDSLETTTNPNLSVNNKIFDLKESLKFNNSKNDLVFISDIRTVSDKNVKTSDLLENYELQNQIVDFLKPRVSLLKWRCPFPDDWVKDFNIPIGDEYLQPYNASYSNELRLSCSSPYTYRTITKNDSIDYEEILFYYNKVLRKNYKNDDIICEYIFSKMTDSMKNIININDRSTHEILSVLKDNIETEK